MAFPDYPHPHPRSPQDPLGPPPMQMAPYRFTREELQVLKQCNRESFYGRCIPFMTSLGLGAYYGVHLGYLKANAKYGSTPKVILGLIIGFVGGKLSYKEKCEEKILALPGGKLKEAILMRKQGRDGNLLKPFDDRLYNDASLSYAMPYVGGNLQSNEAKSISELDTDRPYEPFDDVYRSGSDVDNEIEGLPVPPPSRSVTYDELRKQNRDEYDSRRRTYRSGPLDDYAPYGGTFTPPPVAPREPAQPTQELPQTYITPQRQPPQRKNLYGDVIEK